MNVEWHIDKGLPIPPKIKYGLTPEQRKKAEAAKTMRQTAALKAQGFCGIGGSCKRTRAEGHTMCEHHLVYMRERAAKRNRERKAARQCRQCERPAFADGAFCLVHHTGKQLPLVVRQGIKEFRRREQEREEAERIEAQRNKLRSELYLLDERRQRVLTLRYGLEDGKNRTLQEVGIELGITRERVRQLEESAMNKINVEKGIPVPTQRGEVRDTVKAEVARKLLAMEVGDSFLCSKSLHVTVYHFAKLFGMILTARKQEDGQFRVWMVSKGEQPSE